MPTIVKATVETLSHHIQEQEKFLQHLKERQKGLMQHALEWYHKKGIYKEE